MNPGLDQLIQQALELSAEERSALAVALIESLDPEPDDSVEEAWRAEVLIRLEEMRTGAVQAIPWTEVKARLNKR